MDPQLSGFALGLLFAAAKVGFIGTVGFAIAWWRTRRKLSRLEESLLDLGPSDDRLAALEESTDFMAAKLSELAELQSILTRQINPSIERSTLPSPRPEDARELPAPHTPH